ncbi:MAG: arsenate reductase ArsC [Pseudomonadales bacterium]|nr:arsenate reductase ArsC [Pseudomonadales bacterium]
MKLLFICTHNRCRSILAEAIFNHYGKGLLQAASAGSTPADNVHPLTMQYLAESGIDTRALRSQSWDELAYFKPDIVITVCDSAAQEPCPVWFGNVPKVQWSLPDPTRLSGTDAEVKSAFFSLILLLQNRCQQLIQARLALHKPTSLVELLTDMEQQEKAD